MQRFARPLLAISTVGIAGSCHTTKDYSQTQQTLKDGPQIQQAADPQAAEVQFPLLCATGDPVYFTIAGWDVNTPLPELEPPITGHPPGDDEELFRLDFCIDDAADNPVTFQQMVYKSSSFSGLTVVTVDFESNDSTPRSRFEVEGDFVTVPAQLVETQGLDAALFDQNYQNFLVRLPLVIEDQRYSALDVRGRSHEGGWLVTGVRLYGTSAGDAEPTSVYVRVGNLEPGDPFQLGLCRNHEREEDKVFYLGQIRFETKYCAGFGGGQTTAWGFVSVKVNDPSLPDEQRETTIDGERIADSIRSNFNHHNGCDSFYIKTPYAEYTATAADNVGCGDVVEHAPVPEGQGRGGRLETLTYRVRYGDGEWRQAQVQCWHFLLSRCPVPE